MITLAPSPPIGGKRVTLHGLTWPTYQQILQALPPSRATRLTYVRSRCLRNHPAPRRP